MLSPEQPAKTHASALKAIGTVAVVQTSLALAKFSRAYKWPYYSVMEQELA